MATLKPTTPLLAPKTGPLKPMTPLRPKNAPKSPFLTRKGDGGFNPTQVQASKGDRGFRPPGHLAYRAWLRRPWAVVGPGWTTCRQSEPHVSMPGPTGMEGAGGTCRRAGGWWRGQSKHTYQAPLVWRAPEGPEGTGGLRGAAPNDVRTPSLAGGRGLRRPEHPWGHKRRPDKATAHSEGPEAPQRLGPLARTCVSCSQVELNVAAGDGLDQLARVVLDRVVEQLVRRVGLDELALLHDDHVVGDLADNGQVVRDE